MSGNWLETEAYNRESVIMVLIVFTFYNVWLQDMHPVDPAKEFWTKPIADVWGSAKDYELFMTAEWGYVAVYLERII